MQDSSRFSFEFPLIVVPIAPRFDSQGMYIFDSDAKFLCAEVVGHNQNVLVMFTDDSLAQAYTLAHGIPYEPVYIDIREPAIQIVSFAKDSIRCTGVAVNPSLRGDLVPPIPIDDFLSALRSPESAN